MPPHLEAAGADGDISEVQKGGRGAAGNLGENAEVERSNVALFWHLHKKTTKMVSTCSILASAGIEFMLHYPHTATQCLGDVAIEIAPLCRNCESFARDMARSSPYTCGMALER